MGNYTLTPTRNYHREILEERNSLIEEIERLRAGRDDDSLKRECERLTEENESLKRDLDIVRWNRDSWKVEHDRMAEEIERLRREMSDWREGDLNGVMVHADALRAENEELKRHVEFLQRALENL